MFLTDGPSDSLYRCDAIMDSCNDWPMRSGMGRVLIRPVLSRRASLPIGVLVNTLILTLTIVATGCVLFLAKETRYLMSATDRATQKEVQQHLGQPSRMTTDETGAPIWTYHIREFVQGGNNAWTTAGSWWCDDYTINFDSHGVLRHWRHQSQKCTAS